MNKLVTVIVPTIGRPKYIKSAIDSVLKQDYKEIELLISDNYPEISTRLILNGVLDSRIRIIERDRRYESSTHMNLCINDASGFYIMILSDDDLISPNYISSMVSLLSENENENVIVGLGQQKVLNENDTNIECNGNEFNVSTIMLFDGIEFSLNQFQGKQHLPIYTYFSLFSKKSDVVAAGGFQSYPDGSHADNYLFYSLAFQGKVGFSSSLMGYRIYMASSGLSTPFEKLYLATSAYDKDISSLIWRLVNKSFFEKMKLRLLVKISSVRMLVYRLIRLYKAKIGMTNTIINLVKIVIDFLPKNIMFGVNKF